MTTAPRNKTIVIGGLIALSVLITLVDVVTPVGETFSILFVAVVGACMWLPGLRPIFIAALACTGLTVLINFLEFVPGPRDIDLVNRSFAIVAIWVVALLCALYKRSEQRVQELAAIVESSEDAILTRTLDGVITSWNAGAQRLFGYAAEEVVGRPVDLLIPPDRLDELPRILDAIKRGERVAHFETVRVRKDGSQAPVSLSCSAVVDAHGKAVGVSSIARDITQYKRTAEELQQRVQESAEAEERMRSVVNHVVDGIITIDDRGTVTTFNPAAERTFGYVAQEVIGQNIKMLMPEPYHSQHDGYLANYLRTGEAKIIGIGREVVGRRKDGSTFPMDLAISTFRLGRGRYFTGMVRDITGRRRAEEALRKSEERFRGTFENAAVGIAHEDLAGRFVRFNKRFCAILGYGSEELGGKTLAEVTYPEDLAEDLARFEALTRGETSSYAMEKRFVRKDGTLVWAQLTASLQVEAAGEPAYCIKIIQDITDRKRAEEALRESERRFRALTEALPHLVWTCEPDGTPDYLNARHTEYTGLTLDQLRSRDWRLNLHPEDVTRVHELFTRSIATGERFEAEYRVRRADGAFRWNLGRVLALRDDSGRITKWFGSSVDIDDQKLAAEALGEAKETAEAASRAKSEFLASMSHEIRTPMNGVFGMLDLALDTELQPEQRHYLERARTSADLLLRVINDILDFSKIEAGRLDLEPAPFSLRESLGEAIKAFGPRAHRKGLELALHVRTDTPDGVVGDAMRLGQVLTNLLGNAIKFTDRGEVILSVEGSGMRDEGKESSPQSPVSSLIPHPSSLPKEGQVCLHFAVTDTGPGIPPDKQQLIFGAFAQADSSMARRFGGTGLGLTISARLVELMGGRIWVESEVGKGSTFHFTACFGLHTEPVARLPLEQIDLEGVHVLAADDNETNRSILAEMLANWRMRPTAVGGGRAALAELRRAAQARDPFPLVVLDAVMPDLDGFAVAQEIRRDPALAGATIMMLSSVDRGGELARCRELGIAVYLRKPVKQSELLNAILSALGKLAERKTTPAPPGVPAPDLPHGLRILVVEDNELNQELLAGLLKKRGQTAVFAGDGKAALAAWEREPFDLILMDVQMPDMNGFAVTEAIRAKERGTNTHVPIVALTAHAMKGDRERCLAAGMDEYVTKPIRPAELFEVIARLLPADVEGAQGTPGPEGPPGPVFDLDIALAGVDGDRELLRKMVHLFSRQGPQLLGEIRNAVLRGDGAAVERAAHKLKASVALFGAQTATEAALRLEELGGAGDVTGSQQAYPELDEAVERLQAALADLVREGGAAEP